jgi:triacylglycerol esterase/lipase EstA (alpha/beta hydrolase family)
MLLSAFGELSNIGTNVLDHGVRLAERVSFGQKYLPNRLRHYAGQKRLAVLYHGYAQGRAAFEKMERYLSSPVFDIFPVASGYQPYSQDIRISAEQERERLEYILARTDVKRVALIGHSQGGLIIRDILQRQQYTENIRSCIFLGTPHMGTWAAVLGHVHRAATAVLGSLWGAAGIEGESGRQMIPGSRYLRSLNERDLPSGITYTNIYNYVDPLVWPASYARLPYAEAHNVLVMKIGHLQSLYDLQELDLILRSILLSGSDEKGFAARLVGDQTLLETRAIEGETGSYDEVVASSS